MSSQDQQLSLDNQTQAENVFESENQFFNQFQNNQNYSQTENFGACENNQDFNSNQESEKQIQNQNIKELKEEQKIENQDGDSQNQKNAILNQNSDEHIYENIQIENVQLKNQRFTEQNTIQHTLPENLVKDAQDSKSKEITQKVKKKHPPCKDDFSRGIVHRKSKLKNERLDNDDEAYIENYSSSYKSPNSKDEKDIQPAKRKNKNERNQSKNRSRKRKMSATPPARLLCQRDELQNNMIKEENEDEIDVTQSLFTLQLSNRLNVRPKQSRNQIDQFIMPSFNKKDPRPLRRQNHNQSHQKRVGYHHNSFNEPFKHFNPKDSIFRKISNYASNGEECEENRSELEVDRNIIDITKTQKGNQSDKDDGSQAGSDEDESVSLQDQYLDDINPFKFKFPSFSQVKISNMMLMEIQVAENGSDQMQTQLQQPEEYESLVWGQSIWSTDVPKESKLQFMANLQQMQNLSDINAAGGSGSCVTGKQDTDIIKVAQNTENKNEIEVEQNKTKIKKEGAQNQKYDQSKKNNNYVNRQQITDERIPHHNYHRQHHHYSVSPSKTEFVARAEHHQNHHYQKLQHELHSSHYQQHNIFFDKNNHLSQFYNDKKINQQKLMEQYGIQQQYKNDDNSLNLQYHQNQNFSNFKSNQLNENQLNEFANFKDQSNHYRFMKEESIRQFDYSNISNHSNKQYAGDFGNINKSAVQNQQCEIGTEYPRDDSSNYTHHPYSQYECNTENLPQNNIQKNDNFDDNNHHLHNNQQNKPYMFINRQMNRCLMNPIFKSKQTIASLQMHRYSGILWRGGSHRDLPHGLTDHNINTQVQQYPQLPSENIQNEFTNFPISNQNNQIQNADIVPYFGQKIINNENIHNPFNNSQMNNFQQSYYQNNNDFEQLKIKEQNANNDYNYNKIDKIEQNENVQDENIQQTQQKQKEQQISVNAAPFYPSNIRKTFDSINQTHQDSQNQKNDMPGFPIINNNPQIAYQINSQSQNQNGNGIVFGNMLNNIHHKQKQAQAIHVPIPIPIMNRNIGQKNKNQQSILKQESAEQNANLKSNQGLNNNLNKQQSTSASLIFNTLYEGEILSKKNELDQKMKETTQNLELKINKAVEIDNEDDDQFSEDEDFTFEVHSAHDPSEFNSVERPSSSLNLINQDATNIQKINLNSMSHLNLIKSSQQIQLHLNQGPKSMKNEQSVMQSSANIQENISKHHYDKIKHYEEKVKRRNDRATIFKKLQEQLNQFKTEIFQNGADQKILNSANRQNSKSQSPQRLANQIKQNSSQSIKELQIADEKKPQQKEQNLTPFRQDTKLYLDKVLNLMNMVNEVDDVTNVANLKNMLEKKKLLLLKARAERDQFNTVINKQVLENHQLQQLLKESQEIQQKQQADLQSIIQGMSEQNQRQMNDQIVYYDHQIFELRSQIEQLNQEKLSLDSQNHKLQESLQENRNFYQQQTSQLNSQITELQNSVFQQKNQIQMHIQQIEQQNQNICLIQQNLNKSKMESQILQQKVESSKSNQAALERQLKENQKQLQELKKNKYNQKESQSLMDKNNLFKNLENDDQMENQILQSFENQQQSLSSKITKNDDDGCERIIQKVRSHSYSSGNSKNANKNIKDIKDTNEIEISSFQSSDNSLTINEKLENANQQIKDLQDYIKKKSLEDIKNNQTKLEATQKMEKLHLEQIEEIKNQMEQKDQEKNTIIQNLKDQLKKLEQQKREIIEESKILTPQQLKQLKLMNQDSINDQSIIEARSEDSFENDINQFSVREMINYQCEQCFEKDKIIRINEQKIADYIMQIKQYQLDKISQQQRDQKHEDELFFENLKNSKIIDLQQIEEQKQMGYNQQKDITTNIQNLHSLLNSSQQILLNNFIRQIKQYLSGIEQNHAVDMQYKMKLILGKLESTQEIKLFDEEDLDDCKDHNYFSNESLQKRLETKQRLIYMSLDLLNELLILSTKLQSQLVQKSKEVISAQSSESKSQLSQEKVIEKIIEKTVIQFKTIEFGMSIAELKQMQGVAKEERKACHHIIVEIEKLMYEMNSVLAGAQGQTNYAQLIKLAQNIFGQILDTYLLLPHRLKPIFDHCKKIETTISKAFKNQEQIIKQQQSIQK